MTTKAGRQLERQTDGRQTAPTTAAIVVLYSQQRTLPGQALATSALRLSASDAAEAARAAPASRHVAAAAAQAALRVPQQRPGAMHSIKFLLSGIAEPSPQVQALLGCLAAEDFSLDVVICSFGARAPRPGERPAAPWAHLPSPGSSWATVATARLPNLVPQAAWAAPS